MRYSREVRRFSSTRVLCGFLGLILFPVVVGATEPRAVVPNPYRVDSSEPARLDLSPEAVAARRSATEPTGPRFEDLDKYMLDAEPTPSEARGPMLPPGWVQVGDEVVPAAVAAGAEVRTDALALPAEDALPAYVDEICDFPDQVPPGIYTGEWTAGAEHPRRGTIYLNFLGGVLINGNGENSAENYSVLALSNHKYPVFAGGNDRAIATAQAVMADFSDWAIRVVYLERPHKTIPYVMTMVGGSYTDTTAGPSGGVAPSADCEDVGMRNVCFSFTNFQSATVQANIIGQEIGHTYGLGHTYGKDRIMAYGYNTSGSADMIFGGDCAQIFVAADQGVACSGVNKCHCGDGELQNDKATISVIYAPPGPDMVEPTIDVTAPADGAVYETGSDVIVDVDVWDDYGGYGWKIMVYQGDELLGEKVDYNRSRQFLLVGLPDGTYEAVVEIEDQADHIVQDRITFTVGTPAAETTGGTESGGTDTASTDGSATGTAGTDGTGSGTATDSATAGTDTTGVDEGGCECRTSGARAPAWWLGLPLLALRRRVGGRRRR